MNIWALVSLGYIFVLYLAVRLVMLDFRRINKVQKFICLPILLKAMGCMLSAFFLLECPWLDP